MLRDTYISCLVVYLMTIFKVRNNRILSDYIIRKDTELCVTSSNPVSWHFHGRCKEKNLKHVGKTGFRTTI
jgi:hypothetical protein